MPDLYPVISAHRAEPPRVWGGALDRRGPGTRLRAGARRAAGRRGISSRTALALSGLKANPRTAESVSFR
ncbi:hypothetical protein SKAU_G00087010 [Synaphobranchus kaupii]|uniref:Uncharacterized protein n=1 Tax=Synaphobranchus kaupii TaxID=118154 RepID=A0A9Q1J650_SYNKA|nr:hypothetical protein SKAU_G00087010 [Synaphobranchus kaupii]